MLSKKMAAICVVVTFMASGCTSNSHEKTPQFISTSTESSPTAIITETPLVLAATETPVVTFESTVQVRTKGRIAFVSDRTGADFIYTMDWDGTNQVKFVDAPTTHRNPAWSNDGEHVAFLSGQGFAGSALYVANADGSEMKLLSDEFQFYIGGPVWAPDDTRMAFVAERDNVPGIFLISPTGADLMKLVDGAEPAWSPDGTQIAFIAGQVRTGAVAGARHLYVIDSDGQNLVDLTPVLQDLAYSPFWSLDRSRILFLVELDSSFELYSVKPDGSDLLKLTADLNLCPPTLSPNGQRVAFCTREDSLTMLD
jgi:Tol biopolymer transport system component